MIGAETHGGSVTCTDCGFAFENQPEEIGTLCEDCCTDRDAHTDAFELRLMVKAALRADWTKVRDVA